MTGRVLDRLPAWDQLTDPDPLTGGPDRFATTDCGEECAAIVARHYTGKELAAATVRRLIPGHDLRGETTADELVAVLTMLGVAASSYRVSGIRFRDVVLRNIDQGSPAILLGNWVSPDVLHWVVAVGYGNGHAIIDDPWHGVMRCVAWPMVYSQAAGQYVGGFGKLP